MNEPTKLFGVPILAPGMEALAIEHCLGDCGKACMAGLVVEGIGPMFPCKEESCKFEEAVLEYGTNVIFGELQTLFLRKLKN